MVKSMQGEFLMVLAVGKRIDSQAFIEDAFHHRSDAIISAASLVGISLAIFIGKDFESPDWAALFALVFIIYNTFK